MNDVKARKAAQKVEMDNNEFSMNKQLLEQVASNLKKHEELTADLKMKVGIDWDGDGINDMEYEVDVDVEASNRRK